ncbi:hypothetical protein [Bacillus sp. JJ722]|uniref:hypothetical protein n=1 Tax=Bacillus sp. JJ722 TaxID=3122973 RepID=UPI002FFFA341
MNNLKLVVDETKLQKAGQIESVSFFFHKNLQESSDDKLMKLQVATVLYKGGKQNIINNTITGIALRFYLNPFRLLEADHIFNNHQELRTGLKGGMKAPYYEYIIEGPYTNENGYQAIEPLFADLNQVFHNYFQIMYDQLPVVDLPNSIKELPRYQ